jgi:hypothetical protein
MHRHTSRSRAKQRCRPLYERRAAHLKREMRPRAAEDTAFSLNFL